MITGVWRKSFAMGFVGILIPILFFVQVKTTQAGDVPVQNTDISDTNIDALCSHWFLQRLGDPLLLNNDFSKKLLAENPRPPSLFCRLRAIYLATEYDNTNAAELLKMGRNLAFEMLSANPHWTGISLKNVSKHLVQTRPGDIQALFWIGYFWGHQLKYMPTFSAIAQRSDVLAILKKCAEHDPTIYAGAANTWLGAYYASLPRYFGRDLAKAKRYFSQALEHTQGNLLRLITYADTYLGATNNNERLIKLRKIAQTEPSATSIWYVENTMAKRDARSTIGIP